MLLENLSEEDLKRLTNNCYTVYKQYEHLLDAYILDFYTENHWNQLPNSWKTFFNYLNPEDIGDIIDVNVPLIKSFVVPLSILAQRVVIKQFSLDRQPKPIEYNGNEDSLDNIFWKNVKAKKKHEIELVAELCYKLSKKTGVSHIIDVGSGMGHLSKILTYKYQLQVISIEAQDNLTSKARKLDNELVKVINKNSKDVNLNPIPSPVHITLKIDTTSDGSDIIEVLTKVLPNGTKFGIVGLHTCGNLASTLIRLFNHYSQVQFINIVGCCYMKLTTEGNSNHIGYPLSRFCTERNHQLEYCSREIACHAIENYGIRLKEGEHWQLKIHAYRAGLEKLIAKKWPHLRHCSLNNVKYTNELSFSEYCKRALSKLNLTVDEMDVNLISNDLEEWMKVVFYYSMKLMLAPLVETIISLDRILFVHEAGFNATIVPLFSPNISPRNQVLIGMK